MSLGKYEENLAIARIDYLHTTPRVIAGAESMSKVGEEAKRLGGKKTLVVTDKIIRKQGFPERAVEFLKAQGLNADVFDDIPGEPTIDSLRNAADYMKKNKYDSVVGIGGGAVIDTAKTCAIMVTNPGDVKDYAATVETAWEDKVKNKGVPLIVLPTTAGTGSENTGGIMIIDGDYKTWIGSLYAYPTVAILDPTLTLTMPQRMTAGSGMDALSHALEGYMIEALANPWAESFALEAIRRISQHLRKAYHDGKNLQARWNMSWAAHIAGWVAMYTCGPATLGHCLSEALGSKYKIPHGAMCGICLPYAMEFNLPAIPERLAAVASAMGEDVTGMSSHDAAYKAVEAVLALMKDVDIPTSMKPYNPPASDVAKLGEYVAKERQYMYNIPRLNPRKFTVENITEVLQKMWAGKIGKSI